jgi:hypothetical protein
VRTPDPTAAWPPQASAPLPSHRHLTVERIAQWLAAPSAEPESLLLIEHLAEGCATCSTAFQELQRLMRDVGHSDPRVAVFEGLDFAGLWRELEPLRPDQRLARVRQDERFHTWALCRFVQRMSLAMAHECPYDAAGLAALALAVWSGLEGLSAYGAEALADLHAELLACHAHALRGLGEPNAAAAAFEAAEAAIQVGSGDPRVQAGIDLLTSLLHHDQHREKDALALLERAFEVYARQGDQDADLAAEALATRAWCLRRRGKALEAAPLMEQMVERIERGECPRLALGVLEEEVACLLDLGGESPRGREVAAKAAELLAQMERLDLPPVDRARVRRAQGRLAASANRWPDAEAALSLAVQEFAREGRATLEVLTQVELAGVRAAQGADPVPIVDDLDPLHAAVAADEFNIKQMIIFFAFRDACRDHTLTPALARELADRLDVQGAGRPPWTTSLP